MTAEAMRAAFDKSYPKDGADLAMYENNSDYVLESIGARHRFAAFELGWQAATLAERERAAEVCEEQARECLDGEAANSCECCADAIRNGETS